MYSKWNINTMFNFIILFENDSQILSNIDSSISCYDSIILFEDDSWIPISLMILSIISNFVILFEDLRILHFILLLTMINN